MGHRAGPSEFARAVGTPVPTDSMTARISSRGTGRVRGSAGDPRLVDAPGGLDLYVLLVVEQVLQAPGMSVAQQAGAAVQGPVCRAERVA
ncbi:hypothetical protein N865_16075 [Intrasporangium oryzae NRRL B-24470]|uniref:Uncharacterized protein n=1 Tax=Intrasporangium oryzae NRRL B-24470 TaxID=1386089 RepID=W9G301_9MICO|nr:hypothetical protein N865_16075 [Intrasporangium oryzae NRRL B-24470]